MRNSLRAPFPYFLNDEWKNLFLSVAVSVFVVMMMLSFNPFAARQPDKTILIGLLTFIVLFPAVVVTPRIFPEVFDPSAWTFGKHLVFNAGLLVVIGAVITTTLYMRGSYPFFTFSQALAHVYSDVFVYGIIPNIIIALLMKNGMLKENLRNALKATHELVKIQSLKIKDDHAPENSVTVHSDTSETMKIHLPDLLFAESSDNYVTFFWRKNGVTGKKIMRMNLKSVENQLNNSFAVRCHRSYVVNIYCIESISGNTNGYKLTLMGGDFSIPVSRSKGKEVIEKIGQIRSVMELT